MRFDTLFIRFQQLIPAKALGRFVYRLSRSQIRWLKNFLIWAFIRLYPVDTREMDKPTPYAYSSFNNFFSRSLKANARPITANPSGICCPADGVVQQIGHIADGQLLQAKGIHYRLVDLLGIDNAAEFDGGAFLTIYLAPHNYHRVHAPISGVVSRTHYIPGHRYAVNKTTAQSLPGLFAKNERLACYCTGQPSPYWLVLVGAMNVCSMSTAWCEEIKPGDRPYQRTFTNDQTTINKGDYFGHFNMGSTVIVVFPRKTVSWDPDLSAGTSLRVGREIGSL
jgi:phosphatidylserine decarboxylase